MKVHQIETHERRARTRRVARGGKRGTTAGRGQKGQKSRAGRKLRPALRDLIARIPKHRGFRNKIKAPKPHTVQLARLQQKVKPLLEGTATNKHVVDATVLKQLRLVPARHHGSIKVIGQSKSDVVLTLKGIECSEGVKAAIEKAGGKVVS